MLTLLSHLYAHYTWILATDLAENDRKLQETFNPDEPIESFYTSLNECADYATAADDPITEGKFVRISYGLVAETGNSRKTAKPGEPSWSRKIPGQRSSHISLKRRLTCRNVSKPPVKGGTIP